MSVAIVTDSTSDLPCDVVERFGIHVIPAIVIVEGKAYEDGEGLPRQDFYQKLPEMKSPPSTAAPSAGKFTSLYQALFEEGASRIVSIHLSSELSGIYNSAWIGAEPFGRKVFVIDSGQLTLGLGFQVMSAADAASRGADIEGILNAISNTRERIRVVAMIDTLDYLRRSGRVSTLKASLGSLLSMRLFVQVHEGKVRILEQHRTRRKSITRLEVMIKELGELDRLAILHTNAKNDANQISQNLEGEIPDSTFLVNVTTVIGTHVGPKALGFAAVLRSW